MKKLHLEKETIVRLQDKDLDPLNGGATDIPSVKIDPPENDTVGRAASCCSKTCG